MTKKFFKFLFGFFEKNTLFRYLIVKSQSRSYFSISLSEIHISK